MDAMGQLFYSLSVAMGIMITYGSYVKDDVDLNKSIRNIEIFDTIAAFLAGLMIIPAVYVFMGKEGMSENGPSLMFVSLPKIFDEMGFAGNIVGIVFFIMVLFAALTSCVSIMETLVASCMEKFKKSRKVVSLTIAGIYAGAATIICLGYNVLFFSVKMPTGGTGQLLDIMDYISNYVLMPVVSILTCILIGWIMKPKYIIDEVKKSSTSFKREKLYSVMIKYIAPVMLVVLLLKSLGLF
jgi:NSS family neurotransmitter:Na+ symporter